ncbi:Nn.00g043200.m01.CDS01 [Neocucurbitaria sp. VM-36]
MEAATAGHTKLDEAMRAWFRSEHSIKPKDRDPFTETDLRGISDVLRRSGRLSWSRIPRIYAILRTIDQIAAIDIFVSNEITDLSFPFDQRTLPGAFKSQSARCDFLEAQALVLSKALDLERENGKHRHFANVADVPFQKLAELGKGGSGYVDKVRSTVTYKEYARKLLPRGRTFRKDQNVLRDFERELGTLKKLSHQHIVELIGSYTDPRCVGILMSPVADANLKEFMNATPLPEEERSFLRTFFGCLAAALRYLHENRIRHKDIKPQNVLVKGHHVYLTDFGLSLDWSEVNRSTTTGPSSRTLRYCAPEVAEHEPRNSSADIWSLGCVFLEIWTVLYDYTITDLNVHMTQTGTASSCYHSNINALLAWCAILQSDQKQEHPQPMLWISHMLKTRPTDRCTAQTLVDMIQEAHINPDISLSFIGMCCAEEEDSAESLFSSASESDDFITVEQFHLRKEPSVTELSVQSESSRHKIRPLSLSTPIQHRSPERTTESVQPTRQRSTPSMSTAEVEPAEDSTALHSERYTMNDIRMLESGDMTDLWNDLERMFTFEGDTASRTAASKVNVAERIGNFSYHSMVMPTVNDFLRCWLTPAKEKLKESLSLWQLFRLTDAPSISSMRLLNVQPLSKSTEVYVKHAVHHRRTLSRASKATILDDVSRILDDISVAYVVTGLGFECSLPSHIIPSLLNRAGQRIQPTTFAPHSHALNTWRSRLPNPEFVYDIGGPDSMCGYKNAWTRDSIVFRICIIKITIRETYDVVVSLESGNCALFEPIAKAIKYDLGRFDRGEWKPAIKNTIRRTVVREDTPLHL